MKKHTKALLCCIILFSVTTLLWSLTSNHKTDHTSPNNTSDSQNNTSDNKYDIADNYKSDYEIQIRGQTLRLKLSTAVEKGDPYVNNVTETLECMDETISIDNKKALLKALDMCNNIENVHISQTDQQIVINCDPLPPINQVRVFTNSVAAKVMFSSVLGSLGYKVGKSEEVLYLKSHNKKKLVNILHSVLRSKDGWFGLNDQISITVKRNLVTHRNDLIIQHLPSKVPRIAGVHIYGINKRKATVLQNYIQDRYQIDFILPPAYRQDLHQNINGMITKYLISQGYLDACILQSNIFISPKGNIVYSVEVQEGDLYKCKKVQLMDLSYLRNPEDYKHLTAQEKVKIQNLLDKLEIPGDITDQNSESIRTVNSSILKILDIDGKRFNSNTNLVFSVDDEKKTAEFFLQVNPGSYNVKLNKFTITGIEFDARKLKSLLNLFETNNSYISQKTLATVQQSIIATFRNLAYCNYKVTIDPNDPHKGNVEFAAIAAPKPTKFEPLSISSQIYQGSLLHTVSTNPSIDNLADTGINIATEIVILKHYGDLGSFFKTCFKDPKKLFDASLTGYVTFPNVFSNCLPTSAQISTTYNKGITLGLYQPFLVFSSHIFNVGYLKQISTSEDKFIISAVASKTGLLKSPLWNISPYTSKVLLSYSIPNIFATGNSIPTRGRSTEFHATINPEAASLSAEHSIHSSLINKSWLVQYNASTSHLIPFKSNLYIDSLGLVSSNNFVRDASLMPGAKTKIITRKQNKDSVFSFSTGIFRLGFKIIKPIGSLDTIITPQTSAVILGVELIFNSFQKHLFKTLSASKVDTKGNPFALVLALYFHFYFAFLGHVNIGLGVDALDLIKSRSGKAKIIFFSGTMI